MSVNPAKPLLRVTHTLSSPLPMSFPSCQHPLLLQTLPQASTGSPVLHDAPKPSTRRQLLKPPDNRPPAPACLIADNPPTVEHTWISRLAAQFHRSTGSWRPQKRFHDADDSSGRDAHVESLHSRSVPRFLPPSFVPAHQHHPEQAHKPPQLSERFKPSPSTVQANSPGQQPAGCT